MRKDTANPVHLAYTFANQVDKLPVQKLTAKWIEAAKPGEKRIEFFDADPAHKGLSLVIGVGGTKTWWRHYTASVAGSRRRIKLGSHPFMSLVDARAAARAVAVKVDGGHDPAADKRAGAELSEVERADTVAKLFEAYFESDAFRRTSAKNQHDLKRAMERDVLPFIGGKPISELTRRVALDPVEKKGRTGKHRMAGMLFTYLKIIFNWGMDTGRLDANPLPRKYANAVAAPARDRVLTDEEIRALWRDFPKWTAGEDRTAIYRLLLLTGQRAGEVAGMRRDEIDTVGAIWRLPAERTKNSRAHDVPLSDAAMAIVAERLRAVNGDFLFPTNSGEVRDHVEPDTVANTIRAWHEGRDETDRWTPHDLRRTVSTRLNEMGIGPHIVEAVVNHVSGARAGVAGVYNRATYIDQKRAALDAWADEVARIMEA